MAQLPTEVSEAIAMASIGEGPKEVDDSLVQRVLKRIAAIFGQAIESETAEREGSESESDAVEPKSAGCDTNLTYGYPPAYGVPANVAVRLLTEALSVLKELEGSVEGSLAEKVSLLVQKISEALGVAANATVEAAKTADWLKEIQLAITVQQGTQPVLPPTEAAARLRAAWERWSDIVNTNFNVGVGEAFQAMFELRAAVDIALRSLLALSEATQSQQSDTSSESNDESQIDSSDASTLESQEIASGQQVSGDENSQDNKAETSDSPDTTVVAEMAGQNSNDVSEVTDKEPDSTDDRHQAAPDLASIVLQLAAQVNELTDRLHALEAQMRERRRVTVFAASAESSSPEADLFRRWQKATTDAERRQILKEAQRLLAEPIPINRD